MVENSETKYIGFLQMTDNCLTCGEHFSAESFQFSLGDRRKGLSGIWQLVKCNNCGVISMVPMPTDEQLAAYYDAYSKDDGVDLTRRTGVHYPRLRKLFHQISGDVDPRDFMDVPVGARVLDYGCGQAGYLCDFHDQGVVISGAEIAGHLVDACRNNGLDVHKVDDFSYIPFEDGTFEIVYLMQVFEHLRDPRGFMQELARILKNDGVLYLILPNAASVWRKIFGKNWVTGWFVPFHLFYYDRPMLAKIAREQGFEVVESWSSTPESWFRLNLKAYLYPKENNLDWRQTWLDALPMRLIIMIFLRIFELPLHERDCLVMKFLRRK